MVIGVITIAYHRVIHPAYNAVRFPHRVLRSHEPRAWISGMSDRTTDFCVLLGPDYAGKSSVLSALAAADGRRRIVSTDPAFLEPRHRLLAALRRHLVEDVMRAPPHTYSREFANSLMQCAVVYVRDRIADARPGTPVLVDSYYYKILAKCRLAEGGASHPLYAWWRSLPRPRHVVYLDVEPATAWRRAGDGALVNPMEHYAETGGGHASFAEFEAYQTDLRDVMFEELGDVPVSIVHEQPGIAEAVRAVRKVLLDHDHH